jgi:hypothetical protein
LKVKDEVAHLLGFELSQRLAKLLVGGGAEAAYLDITYFGGNHVGRIKGVYGNLVAYDIECQGLFVSASYDTEAYDGVLGTAKAFDDFVAANPKSFLKLTAQLGAARCVAAAGDKKKALERLDALKAECDKDELAQERIAATSALVKRYEAKK